MRYLLDVNALVALGFLEHEFHERISLWLQKQEVVTVRIHHRWVKSGRQTTDGHLAELARAHDSVLATLDERIPSAFVIPA